MKYILASNSPRRKELMHLISNDFLCVPPDIDEELNRYFTNEFIQDKLAYCPEYFPMFLSKLKGESIAKQNADKVVIACDTVVYFDNKLFNKPCSVENAVETLSALSNHTHKIISGYSIFYNGKVVTDFDVTEVTFKSLSKIDIITYVLTERPLDKAGAYGIQDAGCNLVEGFIGSLNNAVGFPIEKIKASIQLFTKDKENN